MQEDTLVDIRGQAIKVTPTVGWFVSCENCGVTTDELPYEQDPSSFESAESAAEWALAYGWEVIDGDLFCDECVVKCGECGSTRNVESTYCGSLCAVCIAKLKLDPDAIVN